MRGMGWRKGANSRCKEKQPMGFHKISHGLFLLWKRRKYGLAQLGNVNLVWWAFPIAELLSAAVSVGFLIRINQKIISKIPYTGKLHDKK